MFASTMLAPVGMLKQKDITIPLTKQNTAIKADNIINALKLFTIFFALTAGNIIRLEISRVPIMRMPKTTVIAVKNEIKNW